MSFSPRVKTVVVGIVGFVNFFWLRFFLMVGFFFKIIILNQVFLNQRVTLGDSILLKIVWSDNLTLVTLAVKTKASGLNRRETKAGGLICKTKWLVT